MAEIAQTVEKNCQSKGRGEVAYNHTQGTRIERIYVSTEVQEHLVARHLAIVCLNSDTELVPRVITDKIAKREASPVVRVKKTSIEVDTDDAYVAYQIPADLTWQFLT